MVVSIILLVMGIIMLIISWVGIYTWGDETNIWDVVFTQSLAIFFIMVGIIGFILVTEASKEKPKFETETIKQVQPDKDKNTIYIKIEKQ